MITKDNLEYLCVNIGNISGVPVRVYKDNQRIFYYSITHFFKDPFELDKEKALSLKETITYYQSSFYYYYGIINYQNLKIVVGPTRELPISKQDIKSLAFSLEIPSTDVDEFIQEMENLMMLPLMSLLQILMTANFALTGERITLENISIHESTQNLLKEEMGKEEANRTMEALEGNPINPYNALDTENRLMDMIMRGDVSALRQFIETIPAIRNGRVAEEQLRQNKNIFIVTTTLVSRAAIRGGMDVTAALQLSDSYIQRCELANDIETITDLHYLMVLDYAERVEKIRFGKNPSKLVIDVSNYVQAHLSDAIKTSDIAEALYMGRSRLSINFKNQTGMNISNYIMMMKIDEAKRLLRYSEKTFVAISMYLGFSSQSHFTKVFKKYTESTPFEYRQMHKH